MSEAQQIRAALAKLTVVLCEIARTADAKNLTRCPYKTADLRCTYQGGCQNQMWDRLPSAGPKHVRCAGDDLNFEPVHPKP